jgi:predicted dehydrogenase
MNEVRFGIIGIGNMGKGHIGSVSKIPGAKLTAVCDMNSGVVEKAATENGVKGFTDSAEMLSSGEVDAVIIATPHYMHTDLTIAAFEAGIHVLCEKPIAVHKALAVKMLEAHKKHPELKFAAMFNQRTDPAYRKIKSMIDRGELGDIKRVNWIITTWFRSQAYYDSGSWRATWKGEGGGVLLNQCPHQLDLFQWMFGMPDKVRASCFIGKYHDIEVEDEVTAYCEFSNGATGVFITSTGEIPGTNRLEIVGDRGRLVYEDNKISFKRSEKGTLEFIKTSESGFRIPDIWEIDIPAGVATESQHQQIIQNFTDSILKGSALIAEGDEGINSVELGNAMLYSSMNDTTVQMPLNGEAYQEMLEKLIENSNFVKTGIKKDNSDDFSKSFA